MLYRDAPLFTMLGRAFGMCADQFDIIHSHLGLIGLPLARLSPTPVLTTLHGRLDPPELIPVFDEFAELPLVSISQAQLRPIPSANWQSTIHHGLPQALYSLHPEPGKYLAFLGRISPEKGADHAIEIAKRVGIPIRIAAKVDPADRDYFTTLIDPLLDHPLVEYLGEITDKEKDDFLGNALAAICPYDWPEPFGLVFIEALACGTPVIAYRRGSVPEVLDHEQTGFICDTLEEMVKAVTHISSVDRRHCREVFEEQFTVERMTQAYLSLFEQLTKTTGQHAMKQGLLQTSAAVEQTEENLAA
jgi:glycosyltransferase involved in cell wall biosynthesis